MTRGDSDARWFVAVEVHVRSSAARPEFGAGERLDAPGVAQLESARLRGLRTAVLTRDRAFYGDDLDWLVDHWIDCDTGNAAAIAAAAGSLTGVVAALTSSVDGFSGPAAAAARALGLRGPTPGTPALAHDEAAVRRALTAAGIPGVRWAEVSAADAELDAPVGYPCLVMPVDGGTGWDVGLVSDDSELRAVAARHRARHCYGRALRPRHRLIVEEVTRGPRFSADGFVDEDGPVVLAWSERVMAAPPHHTELAVTATTQPPGAGVADAVRSWLAAVGYDFGPFHVEFVMGSGGPRLVMFRPRVVDAGAHHCVDRVSGVDTVDLWVARLLGERPASGAVGGPVGASTQMFLTSQVIGRVRAVSGVRDVGCIPGLVVAEVFTDIGSPAMPPTCSRERLGHVLTVGETPEQSRRRAATALDTICVEIDELVPA
ncbi:ATP-grasp domain-containing protein [Blastococcus montanus]|uniref:ATP-grasp domain-containing protein n=1 Tax=Blastococcus montanus TaxID=3144973 RepID=UPI00320A0005